MERRPNEAHNSLELKILVEGREKNKRKTTPTFLFKIVLL